MSSAPLLTLVWKGPSDSWAVQLSFAIARLRGLLKETRQIRPSQMRVVMGKNAAWAAGPLPPCSLALLSRRSGLQGTGTMFAHLLKLEAP